MFIIVYKQCIRYNYYDNKYGCIMFLLKCQYFSQFYIILAEPVRMKTEIFFDDSNGKSLKDNFILQ